MTLKKHLKHNSQECFYKQCSKMAHQFIKDWGFRLQLKLSLKHDYESNIGYCQMNKIGANTTFRYNWILIEITFDKTPDAPLPLTANLQETAVLCIWCLFLRVAFHQGWTRPEGPATMGWLRGSTGTATASTLPIADPSTSTDGRYPSKPKS